MPAENNKLSRLNFLRMTTLSGLGVLLKTDPLAKVISAAVADVVGNQVASSFSCEIFRTDDLLHLRYYFFNAKVQHGRLRNVSDEYPVLLYVQLPPQHVSQELLVNPHRYVVREDYNDLHSFSAGSSMIAFRVLPSEHKKYQTNLRFDMETLLNWDEHFAMVTLDDFALIKKGYRVDYEYALNDIKKQMLCSPRLDQCKLVRNAMNDDIYPAAMPLTFFEVPYKMFLSPIAQPATVNDYKGDKYPRLLGEHTFSGNNSLSLEYKNKKVGLKIVKPWENKMVFRDLDGNETTPRFKVIHWMSLKDEDNDRVELLPAPIHRYELNGLTMRPEFDRDVLSEFFTVSALGVSTNVLYKNDDPGKKYSTVAWKQQIKLGHDNLVSITFRAIDYFTGLKLHISIIAERDYKAGLSFLPKRYFVAFAEEYKEYDEPIVISKIHCKKIIPLSKGVYFYPRPTPGAGNSAYAVDNGDTDSDTPWDTSRLLDFEYLCIDKAGKEFKKKMKIIFIPAEQFKITQGNYNYYEREQPVATYCKQGCTNGDTVKIEHIGQLDPYKNEDLQAELPEGCGETINQNNSENYKYKLHKTFDHGQKNNLKKTLDDIKKHVEDYVDCYSSKERIEITYADIIKLKENIDSADDNTLSKSRIDKDSANATFPTESILMGAEINETLYTEARRDADNYLEKFPIVPGLQHANVIIKQIDQIEGISRYREVVFADDYKRGKRDLHDYYDENICKLLFKISDSEADFFAKNYRNAGAMVNPGIEIKYVSVLDEGITYSEEHNRNAASRQVVAITKNESARTELTDIGISAASVFKPLKAEILGISLLDILDDVLPVKDMPVFVFAKQAQETVTKLENIAREYQGMVQEWQDRYYEIKRQVETLPASIRDIEKKLKEYERAFSDELIAKAKAWAEGILRQYGILEYYRKLGALLNDGGLQETIKNYKAAVQNISSIIEGQVKIKAEIQAFIAKPDVETLNRLLQATEATINGFSLLVLKQAVIGCVLEKVTNSDKYNEVVTELLKLKEYVDTLENEGKLKYKEYYNVIFEGVKDTAGLIVENADREYEAAKVRVDEIEKNVETFFLKYDDDVIFHVQKFYQLKSMYGYYADIYKKFRKGEYEALASEIGIVLPDISVIEKHLKKELIKELDNISFKQVPDQYNEIKNIAIVYCNKVKETIDDINDAGKVFESYRDIVSLIEKEIEKELKTTFNTEELLEYALIAALDIDEEYLRIQQELQEYKQLFDNAEKELKNFGKNLLEEFKRQLDVKKEELLTAVKGSQEYKDAYKAITEIQSILKKLQQVANQKLEYKFTTRNFRPATFAGVIDFAPNSGGKTNLNVQVNYNVEFDISEWDSLPTIKRQSFVTDSEFTNFRLGILKMLHIEFAKVRFITGSDVKDDFEVSIRNVQFGGPLNFVEAFKDYLKSIDKNLVFDINASGARIGYGITIPNFTAGYFNFFNLTLSGLFILPFDPKKSLQIVFGFGNELNKFGITVSGIFGGQGYFNIIAEPRRGIVGMVLVLEFGAIFNLNIGVAWGTAYLVGGIYIKRYYGNFELRGYILCVGRLNILGIFSSSLTFYLGLEGNGHTLKGRCVVTASKRFSRWFTISVSCPFEKTLKGAKSNHKAPNDSSDTLETRTTSNTAINIESSNLNRAYATNDLELSLSMPETATVTARLYRVTPSGKDSFQPVPLNSEVHRGMRWVELDYDTAHNKSIFDNNEYKLEISITNDGVTESFDESINTRCNDFENREVSVEDYYGAFFHL